MIKETLTTKDERRKKTGQKEKKATDIGKEKKKRKNPEVSVIQSYWKKISERRSGGEGGRKRWEAIKKEGRDSEENRKTGNGERERSLD